MFVCAAGNGIARRKKENDVGGVARWSGRLCPIVILWSTSSHGGSWRLLLTKVVVSDAFGPSFDKLGYALS